MRVNKLNIAVQKETQEEAHILLNLLDAKRTSAKHCENFDRSKKLSVIDVLPSHPESIQKVAYAVTALPTTQVSIERLFSSLRVIKSDLRSRLGEDLINAICSCKQTGLDPKFFLCYAAVCFFNSLKLH